MVALNFIIRTCLVVFGALGSADVDDRQRPMVDRNMTVSLAELDTSKVALYLYFFNLF